MVLWAPQWRLTRRTSTNQMPSKGLYGMRFTSVVRQLGRLPNNREMISFWCYDMSLSKTWVQLPGHPHNRRTVGQEGRQLACVVQWIVDALHRISHLVTGKSKWLGVIIDLPATYYNNKHNYDLPIIKIGGSFHSYVSPFTRGYVHFQS